MNDGVVAKFTSMALRMLFVTLLATSFLWQFHLVGYLDFDGELLSTDAESLYGLRCARNGELPYHDFSRPPHVVTLYGPLFYIVPGTIARLLNTSWIGTIVCGRWYTYTAWLGVGLMIYALGRQAGCQRTIAMVAALLWLSGTLASPWAVAYRPDAAALLLSLSALWMYERRKSAMTVGATVALLVAAFLHKQTSVAVLLAIAVTEIEQRRFARAAAVIGGWTICTAAAVTVMQWLTGGAFVKNAFEAVALWAGAGQAWVLLREAMIQGIAVFTGGALAYVVARGDGRLTLLRRSFGVSFVLALAISTKAGAQVNYYLEPFAVACVLTSGLLRNQTWVATSRIAKQFYIGWLGLTVAVSATDLSWKAARLPEWWRAVVDHRAVRAQSAQEWSRLAACLGKLDDRVLVEDLYLAVRQSQKLFALHPRHLEALRGAGMFDDLELLQRIVDGRFDAIVASFPLENEAPTRQFPLRWREAARGRYVLEKRCVGSKPDDTFYVYRPVRD